MFAVMLALPQSAHAHGGEAQVEIDNRFDGEAAVYVEGRYVGTVAGDAAARFETRPGNVDVSVRRPGTGYVLASARVHVHRGEPATLVVDPPPATVRVQNAGDVGLKLDLGARDAFLAPGATLELVVPSGRLELQASIHDPRGDWVAVERSVWVEPGRPAEVTLRPDPTVLAVTNGQVVPLRILLDGVDAGWVASGEALRVWVRPGPTTVVLLDGMGRVHEERHLLVARGQEVEVTAARPVLGVPIAHRPGGPLRFPFR